MSAHIVGILVCGLVLTPLAACHNWAGVPAQPSPAQQAASVEELVARFPVVVVHTSALGFVIRIRGVTAPFAPLYVVDGNPVEIDPRRGIDWLRPADIARIEVLRYPAETSVYGPRGANGVVLITTRRGR